MNTPRREKNQRDSRTPKKWSTWRLFTAWIVALTVAAAILLAFRHEMARADEPPFQDDAYYLQHDKGSMPQQRYCRGDELSRLDQSPAADTFGYPGSAQETASEPTGRCGTTAVWSTTVTMGRITDNTNTFLGYAATGPSYFGSVGDTDFHFNRRDYTVEALY